MSLLTESSRACVVGVNEVAILANPGTHEEISVVVHVKGITCGEAGSQLAGLETGRPESDAVAATTFVLDTFGKWEAQL